jgi:GT2 family glycosyltransferase/O-antigen/teichoic acid export membrane protein
VTLHERALTSEVGNQDDSTGTRSVAELPSVSVVICCYMLGRLSDVLKAIQSMQRQDIQPSELIVVVDHNPELLVAAREAVGNGIALIENTGERGLSGARNTGIAYATADLVLFLDDDAVADPTCLRLLAQCFCDSGVIGVGALIKPDWRSAPPRWFPGEFLWVVGCSYSGLKAGVTRNLIGAAMCIRREVFAKIGGFDSSLGRRHVALPLGCEETELCIRASQAFPGRRFLFQPATHVDHKVPADRLSFAYFTTRCYAEGLSKAHLSTLAGTDRSLSSERVYLLRTLPQAIAGNLRGVLRGDVAGLGRSAAIVLGVTYTAWGFAVGRSKLISSRTIAATKLLAVGADPSSRATAAGSREKSFLPSIRGATARLIGDHGALFSNAALLALGTGLSSCLGFIYWWLAARSFPPAAVGAAAAAISLMNFVGHVGEVGLGALLIGEVHRYKGKQGEFITAGLAVSGTVSAVLALCYILASATFETNLDLGLNGSGAAFILGCAFAGLTLVLDQALVGLLRSWLQVTRNVSFAFVKLVLLAALPLLLGAGGQREGTILASWVVGQIASIGLLCVVAQRGLESVVDRPNLGLLKPLLLGVAGHHGLNLVSLAPGLLLPFVVTTVLSPTINAAFYAAWTMMSVAYLVPASLATVVFAVGAKDRSASVTKLRASLCLSMLAGVTVATVVITLPNVLLGLFSPTYAEIAAPSLRILALSIFPVAVKYHYQSIQRLDNQMLRASLLAGFGCLLELAGAIVGGSYGDLLGLSFGWLTGLSIEAVLMTPTVLVHLMGARTQPAAIRAVMPFKGQQVGNLVDGR